MPQRPTAAGCNRWLDGVSATLPPLNRMFVTCPGCRIVFRSEVERATVAHIDELPVPPRLRRTLGADRSTVAAMKPIDVDDGHAR